MYGTHTRGETKLPFQKSQSHCSFVGASECPDSFSLSYFFSHIDRLFAPNYTPTTQDIVHCRARTIGISETLFHINKDRDLLLVDVGGQRSERRKWIHCFQGVTGILFLASLSGYDQCLVEDKNAVRRSVPVNPIVTPLTYSPESNAGRVDNISFNISFEMVQRHKNCEQTQ